MHLNLKRPWSEVKELLKEDDHSLTDDDLNLKPGQDEAFLEKFAVRISKSPEQAKAYIESIAANTAKAG